MSPDRKGGSGFSNTYLTAVFFKLMQCQSQLNCEIKPFVVEGFRLTTMYSRNYSITDITLHKMIIIHKLSMLSSDHD